MAASSFLSFLSIILVLASNSLTSATFSPSSIASTQLKFWSKNVHGSMPESLFSKLSPLSMHDSSYFASLIKKKSFSSNANFCSLANLACSSDQFVDIKRITNGYNQYAINHISPTFDDQLDANSFFRNSCLQKGKKVQLPNLHDKFPRRAFLPSQIASSISLSSNELQKLFPESFSSSLTRDAVQTSLQYCDAPTLEGEVKNCPKSLEGMVEFSKKVLGQKLVVAMTSKSAKGSGTALTIGNITQFDAQKVVSCHEVFLPFATYFCHLLSSTQLYSVDLIDIKSKAAVNTLLAICHMDTSAWPKDHVSFKILKSSPGEIEVCHWLTQIDLVWVGQGKEIV